MITIQTRQNRKGNWWCNTTYNGEDISVEGGSPNEAQFLIIKELKERGFVGGRNFSPYKFYNKEDRPTKPTKPKITYATSRIDNNPIA